MISRADAKVAGLKRYFTGKPCKLGHISERNVIGKHCCSCVAGNSRRWRSENHERTLASKRNARNSNKDRALDRERQYRLINPGKTASVARQWRKRNTEKAREYQRAWREKNHQKSLEIQRKYRLEKPEMVRAKNAVRRACKRSACPTWVNRFELVAIYAACPDGHHVDHIVPLKGITPDGRPVSGLHVPWNLRHLPSRENTGRRNRISPDEMAAMESPAINLQSGK